MYPTVSPRFNLRHTKKSLFAALLACAGAASFASPAAHASQTSKVTVVNNLTGIVPPGEEGSSLPQVTPPFKASDGNFYGIAPLGGKYGSGYIYKITSAGVYSLVYAFHDDEFADPPVEQGAQPRVLIEGTDHNLYGVCNSGGLNDDDVYHNGGGTLFKVTLGGVYTKLHDFDTKGGNPNTVPALPVALLQGTDGNLYGLTNAGGTSNGAVGVFFKYILNTKTFSVVHQFIASTGAGGEPLAQLLDGKDGFFYGTTTIAGGSDPNNEGSGTIFKITTAGNVTTIHAFTFDDEDPDNEPPQPDSTPLIKGTDGNLYGSTQRGGGEDEGVIYRSGTTGGAAFAILHTFSGETDGGYPTGGLTQASDGNFYTGLDDGFGETPDSEQLGGYLQLKATSPYAITVIHKFSSGNEHNPFEPFVQLVETGNRGTFYGLTQGGTAAVGTLVKVVISPGITSPTTATATVGTAFTYHIVGTFIPTSFAATGLPAGLTVSTTNGTISGKPTKAGTYKVTISATNAGGTTSVTLTVTVKAA